RFSNRPRRLSTPSGIICCIRRARGAVTGMMMSPWSSSATAATKARLPRNRPSRLRPARVQIITRRMIKNWIGAGACLLAVSSCELASPSEQPAGFQGVIEFEQRRLGFEFAGRVAELHVVEGQRVQAGALLAVLDDSLE